MLKLDKYSFGVGDRFSHQAKAQLSALQEAEKEGLVITPVWNKSYREHSIIGSRPETTREQADLAVNDLGWAHPYFVDADHVGLKNVDYFMDSADFFTFDVADFIGQPANSELKEQFLQYNKKFLGEISFPGLEKNFTVTEDQLNNIADKYLNATQQAGEVYRHIASLKNPNEIVIEVSMDETDEPQTPLEMFFILSALAREKVPLQTIAPKFSGRFNKGVDYVGDVEQFREEFEQDVAAIARAVQEFDLPQNLKLSVHSGSDKFSIYPAINSVLKKFSAGLHLKTAGTTWLEELIGLAEAGRSGLAMAKNIYGKSLQKYEELAAPYATVIDIDQAKLPAADEVAEWSSQQYVDALRHDLSNPAYNLNLRQLLHVGYKIAAQFNQAYIDALEIHREVIARNVKENILERHIRSIFAGLD